MMKLASPEVFQLTPDQCRRQLADALAAAVSREVEEVVTATCGSLGQPVWIPFEAARGRMSRAWVAPLDVTLEAARQQTTVRLDWPVPWSRVGGEACLTAPDEAAVSPGWHAGLYVGVPLATGHGVRLREGVHFIPRPSSSGWKTEVVVASVLGKDVFGNLRKEQTWELLSWAVLGKLPGRYVSEVIRAEMLQSLDLAAATQDRKVVIEALQAKAGATSEAEPRRTAASRSRMIDTNDAMSELVFARMCRTASRVNAQTEGIEVWLVDVVRRIERAGQAALTAIALGKAGVQSIVTRTDSGMTLARVEQSAKTCFIGFRGLGKVRGRADLRDLEAGWRGTLCPVQTPESTDTGLVRFATVGQRDDAPEELADWFDLSASAALIPFVNHDDPARASIGSKNLKQAVPVDCAEPPLVATGWERVFGTAEGAARAPESGRVSKVEPDFVEIKTRRGLSRVNFGAPWQARSGPDNSWSVVVAMGDQVRRGQVVAHAPDTRLDAEDDSAAELCLGVNALVALTPWHGLNYEDGIVVGESFAQRMTSTHLVRVDQPKAPEDYVTWLINPTSATSSSVDKGDALLLVTRHDGRTDTVCAPVSGELLAAFVDADRGAVSLMIRVRRPLAVGDKLSNRHQGKGVVSAILPDDEMPHLPADVPLLGELRGKPVEVILNPVGVLRRLNVGQLWEMHLGLEAMLSDGKQRCVGRVIENPQALGQRLARLGMNDEIGPGDVRTLLTRGRLKLTLSDGSLLGGGDGIVVGPQYMMKLNHLASAKISVRSGEPQKSPITGQPAQTRRFSGHHWVGAAQRLGEMEVWALEAAGATEVLSDALGVRAAPNRWAQGKPRASLRSVQAHLAVAGLDLRVNNSMPQMLESMAVSEVQSLHPTWRTEHLPELPNWRELGRWEKPALELDLASLIAAYGDDSVEPRYLGSDPLYREDIHGRIGSADSERTRYELPLPRAMRHPWQDKGGPKLPPLVSVAVLPPGFRAPAPGGARRGLDYAYQELASLLVEYEKAEVSGSSQTIDRLLKAIRRRVKDILGEPTKPEPDSIFARLQGKRALLRRYLLGQSVVFSARGVIVPDLSLDPDQVGLPFIMMHGLGVNELQPLSDVVVVNRQPSLHPYNLVALRAVLVDGDAIHLHPLVLTGLAGDFDGDTVAVHRPTTHEARLDAWNKLSPAQTLRSSAGGKVLAKMDLDIALGIYLASIAGQELPINLKNGVLADSIVLPHVVDEMVRSATNPSDALDRLAGLERIGLKSATGWSLGALDLLMDGRNGFLNQATAAGVAGGDRAVTQLLDKRGSVAGGHPLTPTVDVDGCFLTGLTSDDYFTTAPGALASLAEKKLTSPHAGALTKTLVEVADPVVITQDRCGTPDDMGSPLTCLATDGPCQACYGNDPGTGRPPEVGSRVGVLAAMLIGERSTQLSMKVFHGGGETGSLGSALAELKAVFGQGRSAAAFGTTKQGNPRNLRSYLVQQGDLADLHHRTDSLKPVIDHAVTVLNGQVARVHIEVIMRQLVDTFAQLDELRDSVPPGQKSLVACAQRRGRSYFEAATARGNLDWILRPTRAGKAELSPGGLRTKLVVGDPS